MKRLRKSQQILVRVDGISFRTTAAMIREGVGSTSSFNRAVIAALQALEHQRDQDIKPIGLVGWWEDYEVQLDIC